MPAFKDTNGDKLRIPYHVEERGNQLYLIDERTDHPIPITEQQRNIYEVFAKRPSLPEGFRQAVYNRDDGISHISGNWIAWKNYQLEHIVAWHEICEEAINDPELLTLSYDELKNARDYLFYYWDNVAVSSRKENGKKGGDSLYDNIQSHECTGDITMTWVEKREQERQEAREKYGRS